jgi:hypothetical protein
MTERVPPALLAQVQRDLRPVRPLASPARRALALLPLGLVLLLGVPLFWYATRNSEGLAPASSWRGSPLETVAGLILLAAAFREAVPGRELGSGAIAALIAIAALGFCALNAPTAVPDPGLPAETARTWLWECIGMAVAFSLPALAGVAWLVARALPSRPALAGALAGLGVGVMTDAGLRLFCWNGELSHIVLGHGGAIALLVAIGAATATLVERRKSNANVSRA